MISTSRGRNSGTARSVGTHLNPRGAAFSTALDAAEDQLSDALKALDRRRMLASYIAFTAPAET